MSPSESRLPPPELFERVEALLREAGATDGQIQSARAAADGLPYRLMSDQAACLGALGVAGAVVGTLARECEWSPQDLRGLVGRIADLTSLPTRFVGSEICLRAMRDPRLVELPPRAAVTAQLAMLFALAPLLELSFWMPDPEGQVRLVAHFGSGRPTRRTRAEARWALKGLPELPGSDKARIHGVPVLRLHRPCAALVLRTRPDDRDRSLALAREAAAAIAPVLERASLLERSASRQDALVESSERRLSRLGFDLHDGAIQDIAALAGDIRLFRDQLGRVLTQADRPDLLLGRVDDLEARLVGIDGSLRDLARSLESSAALRRPFADVIGHEVRAFRVRSEIRPKLELRGDFSALTASQQIALVRIVQEALTNIREHSGATEVGVSIVNRRGTVHAQIVDDGRGFDVERTLVRAARSGRLGLVGMSERVRLLGGSFDVQSQPGGPTKISVTLPEWQPLSEREAGRRDESA